MSARIEVVSGNTDYWLGLAKDQPTEFARQITRVALQASLENPVELAAVISLLIQLVRPDISSAEFYSSDNIYMLPCTWGLIHRNLVRCPGSDTVKASIRAMCNELATKLRPSLKASGHALADIAGRDSYDVDSMYRVALSNDPELFVYANMERCKRIVDQIKDHFENEGAYNVWRMERLALIASTKMVQRHAGWI